jgi:hypothetical protein
MQATVQQQQLRMQLKTATAPLHLTNAAKHGRQKTQI